MARDEFLLSTAMLSTLWEENYKDSLDLLIGFVKYAIAQSTKLYDELDLKTIHITAKKYLYIPNIPEQIIEEILDRLTKKEYGKVLSYDTKNTKYTLVNDLSSYVADFDNKLEKEKSDIADFFNKLAVYYNSKARKELSQDQLKSQFFHFLENEGFDFLRSSDKPNNLREISSDKGQCYFLIAQFILDLYDNKKQEYNTALRITMGYFLSKSIYLDSNKVFFKKNPPLKDLNVYIDTTLLLYILDCKTKYQYNSAMSMVNLLLDNGANLYYYTHNLEEVEEIIKKYKKHRSTPRRTLERFDEEKYTDIQIELFFKSIKENLAAKKIYISDIQPYSSYDHVIDEDGLSNYLASKISGYKGKSNILEHDVKSISSICRERKGIKTNEYENLSCIWVTSNTKLVKYTNKFFENEYKNSFSPIITDRKLTTELWIKYSNKKNNIFESFLLENALLAIEPSEDVVSRFIENVDKFEKMNMISPETAAYVRLVCVNDKNIMLATDGDPEKMTEQTANDLIAEYEQRIVGEYKKELESIQNDYAKRDQEKDNRIALQSKENDEKDKKIEKLSSELESRKTDEEKALLNVDKKADESTATFCTSIKRFAYILLVIIGIVCIVRVIFEIIDLINGNGDIPRLIVFIVAAIVDILLLVIDLVGIVSSFSRLKHKIKFFIKSKYYNKYLSQYKRFRD